MGFADRLSGAFKAKGGVGLDLYRASDALFHTDFLPTGVAAFDCSIGGGFGRGRVHELFGNFSSGKSLVLYLALIRNQMLGGETILLESEGAFDKHFFRALGGNPDTLHLIPVDRVEDVFDAIVAICDAQQSEIKESMKSKNAVVMEKRTVIGWDSIAATGTKHLSEVGMDKRDMSKSIVMSQGSQLIPTLVKASNVTVIATNQTREKVGSKDSATHTPGGNSWSFACSQRVELRYDGGTKGSLIFEGGATAEDGIPPAGRQELGRWIAGYCVKNKLASPFGRFKLPIYSAADFDHPVYEGRKTKLGIDYEEMLFTFFLEGRCYLNENKERVLSQKGAYYKLHPSIDPDQQSFYEKEWADILDTVPTLRNLPYDLSKPVEPPAAPV